MTYNDEDIKSYCGNCKKQFDADIYYCPDCGSNLVNYNTGLPTEKFAVQDRWERHNRDFKREKNGNGQQSYKK
jgi:predicted amidophosphoribosyltransferase